MSLMQEMNQRALALGVPLSAHIDLTFRCNERCVHCYLDHEDYGEMTTAEIRGILDQLAEAGTLFLTLSGGEILLRKDFFEILEYARRLMFDVTLKTNGILIREKQAKRIRDLGVGKVQISVYSHRPEVHDAITKVPGSLERSLDAIRFLKSMGLKVAMAKVLMRQNMQDHAGVQALAAELGAEFKMDPTITPMMSGDRSILNLNIPRPKLHEVLHDESLVGNLEDFCAPPPPVDDSAMDSIPCSAGHSACYISPYGDVYPCVQFPLPSGNVRKQKFIEIWRDSTQLREVRSIRARDLPTCSACPHVGTCTRCPGLAYMEGNMRGPSTADCEKSFVRTGIPSANMLSKMSNAGLVQISTGEIF
jgi:radical SAM protein with 4Fe4S-binding SPASM domain